MRGETSVSGDLEYRRDNARLRHELERAVLIIDAKKTLCVALGPPTADDRNGDT
jgi:hypothetical protein